MDNADYIPERFPRWKYSPSGEGRVVNDEEAEARLGAWWFDSPAERDEAIAIAIAEAIEASKPKPKQKQAERKSKINEFVDSGNPSE